MGVLGVINKTNTLYMYRIHCSVTMPLWYFSSFMKFLRDMQFDVMVVNTGRIRRVLFKGYGIIGIIAVFGTTTDIFDDSVKVPIYNVIRRICQGDIVCEKVLRPNFEQTWIDNKTIIGTDIPELKETLREMMIDAALDVMSSEKVFNLPPIIEETLDEHPEKVSVEVVISEDEENIDISVRLKTDVVSMDVILCMTIDSYGDFDYKPIRKQLLRMLFRYASIDRELLRPM